MTEQQMEAARRIVGNMGYVLPAGTPVFPNGPIPRRAKTHAFIVDDSHCGNDVWFPIFEFETKKIRRTFVSPYRYRELRKNAERWFPRGSF